MSSPHPEMPNSALMNNSSEVVRVRDYSAADLNACLAIFDSNVPRYFTDPERSEFVTFLSALPGPYLILVDERGAVLGCGGYAIVLEAARADLCWGMVREDLHGTGLGRRLTEARLSRAIADPAVKVVALNTSQLTTGFYEQLGFLITEIQQDGYALGLHRCEMRLFLDKSKSSTE